MDRNEEKINSQGVMPHPNGNRIQLTFWIGEQRLRPTVDVPPNERNLRLWAKKLNGRGGIKDQIKLECFDIAKEFPDYRFLKNVAVVAGPDVRTLNMVTKEFLAKFEEKVGENQRSRSMCETYRKILAFRWEAGHTCEGAPLAGGLGAKNFMAITLADLERTASKRKFKSVKTKANVFSAIVKVFKFGYRNSSAQNPALLLDTPEITAQDRPKINPFPVEQAQALIAKVYQMHGEFSGCYDEFRFLTGLRPSEQIALTMSDVDVDAGTISVSKGRVWGEDRARTKTNVEREVELVPAALALLKRYLALRASLKLQGKIDHNLLFVNEEGKRWNDLQVQNDRWNAARNELRQEWRRPYHARHSSITMQLMIGRDPWTVAKLHGTSVITIEKSYGGLLKGGDATKTAIRKMLGLTEAQTRKAA